jgi:hypothetical protein
VRARNVEVSWAYEGEGYVVTAEVSGHHRPATRDDPEEWPDVDVLSVAEEEWAPRPDLLQAASDDPGLIDDVLVCVSEDELASWEDEQERRADFAREEKWLGRD